MLKTCFSNIRLSIIQQSVRCAKWLSSNQFPYQNSICIYYLSFQATSVNVYLWKESIKLSIMTQGIFVRELVTPCLSLMLRALIVS